MIHKKTYNNVTLDNYRTTPYNMIIVVTHSILLYYIVNLHTIFILLVP